jgi:hypothetical protein
MGEPAKAKAPPVKKTQQAAAKKTPQQGSGLRLSTWAPAEVESPRTDPRGGRPLDAHTRGAMESRFGHDFGRVRIHTGPEANRSAAGLAAHAYTLGLDVYFQEGRYRPDHPAGRALLVHELEHVVRAGPRGPEVPKLQPQDPVDFEAKIKEILAAKGGRDTSLRKFVQAHPTSIGTAERLLAGKAVDAKTTVALLGVLFKLDAKSEERVAELTRSNTRDLRWQARLTTRNMWKNYEAAAYQYAFVQWTKKRLEEEKKKRPRLPKGSPPPAPTPVEQQLEAWGKKAQDMLDQSTAARKTLLDASNAALADMMKAAQPVPYVQGDVLEDLSKTINGTISEARRERIHSFDDLALLELRETPAVTRQLAAARNQLIKAREAEKKAADARSALETAPAGETAAQKRRREGRLPGAKRAEATAATGRTRAERALTPEGAGDPDVKAFLRSQDPATRAAAEQRLDAAKTLRNRKLKPVIPVTSLSGVDRMALLDQEQRWWIYHTALNSLESGFPSFTMEYTVRGILTQSTAVAENRKALGVDFNVGIDTYSGHGEGQYDIHVPAGADITAIRPDTVDLTLIFPKTGSKRIFERVSSEVFSAAVLKPEDGDEDVLAKLVYGFFGREVTDRAKMKTFLDTGSGLRPSPDASRIVGAVVLDNVVAGSPPSTAVETARQEIRAALETALHAELRKLKTPVDIADDVKILQTVDASSGWFGGASMVTKEAREAIRAVLGKKASAENLVFETTRRIVLTDATVADPVKKLLSDLLANGKGNRSGPWVTLLHKYREIGKGTEAWIAVDYRHLHSVAAQAGANIESGAAIGQVGSSGNSVSPHIHMAINVYDRNPRERGSKVLGFLLPLDFFPFGRKGR